MLPELDLRANANHSPHVMILGAGASRAACPNGDKNGRQLPVMETLTETLKLGAILRKAGIEVQRGMNFEVVYGRLASESNYDDLRLELEERIRAYFASLELPDHVTLYDKMLLSLRAKDIIATFNWDPFLLQAFARNRSLGNLPRVAFLHGNVYLGHCPEHRVKGYATQNCRECGARLQPSPLLFPIKDKNYNANPLISAEWQELIQFLERAYIVTIFGYAAPESDAAARELMLKAWEANSSRPLALLEIVDILPRRTVETRWADFSADLNSVAKRTARKDFCHTWQFNYVRRSCDSLAFATLQQDPWAIRKLPRFRDLARLQEWVLPLIEEERKLEKSNIPLTPF